MDNVTFIDIELLDGTTETFAITETQSMPKSVYDEQQAQQLGGN